MTLQSEEQVAEDCQCKPSQSSTVTSYSKTQELCIHTTKTHINIAIPLTATPAFITDVGGCFKQHPSAHQHCHSPHSHASIYHRHRWVLQTTSLSILKAFSELNTTKWGAIFWRLTYQSIEIQPFKKRG